MLIFFDELGVLFDLFVDMVEEKLLVLVLCSLVSSSSP
jgi:hypothetical protein